MKDALDPKDDPLPPLGDVLDFLRLVWSVDHGLQRVSKYMETTTGITSPQRLVIRIVARFPSIPAGHLARLLHVHPGTLSGILKRLERQRLIRRRADPKDARRTLLGLTEQGLTFELETEGPVEAVVRRVLERTSPEKLRAAREVLQAIADGLESVHAQSRAEGPRARAEERP